MADGALPAPARMAAEAAYRNWRIGDDGEGRLHAALVAYAAAAQAGADQSLADRMAATEAAIRASERELVALELAGLKDALRRHLPSFIDPNNGEAVCGGCLEPSPCPDAALLGEEATS